MEGIEKFLNIKYDGIRPYFSPYHIEYLLLVSEYYKLYGRENVLVQPYEMFREDPLQFIHRLGIFLGVEIKEDELDFGYFHNKKKNHFINYYMRLLNLLTCYSSANNYSPLCNKYSKFTGQVIVKACASLLPGSLDVALQKKLREYINSWVGDRYLQSNKELSQWIGVDLSQYGYYEDV